MNATDTQQQPPQKPEPKRTLRGSKNPLWNKGPTLQEQRMFLQGFNREEYIRKHCH